MKNSKTNGCTNSLILAFISGIFLFSSHVSAQTNPILGPFGYISSEYSAGQFSPTGSPAGKEVDIKARVHFPELLNEAQDRFPLIVILHAHTSLSNAYEGYDYIAQDLASHGYIVVSINAKNIEYAEDEMLARAQLIEHHLDIWNAFNDNNPSPTGLVSTFVGRVDIKNIGLIGHSRGGEGVATYIDLNRQNNSPYSVNAVLLLAPDVSQDPNDPSILIDGVPLGVILPYCDGDLIGLRGAQYNEANRVNPMDEAPRHTFLMTGATHNRFNTVLENNTDTTWWLSAPYEPYCGSFSPEWMSLADQKQVGLTYISAFFRSYLGGETQFIQQLTQDRRINNGSLSDAVLTTYQTAYSSRLDINRLDLFTSRFLNSLGAGVGISEGVVEYNICNGSCSSEIQTPAKWPNNIKVLNLGWDRAYPSCNTTNVYFENRLSPSSVLDVRSFDFLQFRVALNVNHPQLFTQDFKVELAGPAGSVSVPVSSFSDALYEPPGLEHIKTTLSTVRIPLSAFDAVDLSQVSSVRFNFETCKGDILVSDLALAKDDVRANQISPRPALDGPYLAYVKYQDSAFGNGNIVVEKLFGTILTPYQTITLSPPAGSRRVITDISIEGSYIAWREQEWSGPTFSTLQSQGLGLRNMAESNNSTLVLQGNYSPDIEVLSDGDVVLLKNMTGNEFSLARLDVTSSAENILTNSSIDVQPGTLSSDGQFTVFVAISNGQRDIWLMDMNTSANPIIIANNVGVNVYPVVDAGKVAWVDYDSGSQSKAIFVRDDQSQGTGGAVVFYGSGIDTNIDLDNDVVVFRQLVGSGYRGFELDLQGTLIPQTIGGAEQNPKNLVISSGLIAWESGMEVGRNPDLSPPTIKSVDTPPTPAGEKVVIVFEKDSGIAQVPDIFKIIWYLDTFPFSSGTIDSTSTTWDNFHPTYVEILDAGMFAGDKHYNFFIKSCDSNGHCGAMSEIFSKDLDFQ